MEDTKTHRDDYTRVSTVLYPYSGLQHIDSTVLARAANRGTKVHNICEGILRGIGEHGGDEETEPYMKSFHQWYDPGMEVLEVERRFWDDELKITGQCDAIIEEEDGTLSIIDFKTSYRPSLTWPVQGAAYAYLASLEGIKISTIKFVHLLRTGKAAKVYEYPINPDMFLSCVKVHKYFLAKNTTKK